MANKDDAYNTAPWHYCFVITLSRLKRQVGENAAGPYRPPRDIR